MGEYIMTVSYGNTPEKQYPAIDRELDELIDLLHTDEKFKPYNVRVKDISLSTAFCPMPDPNDWFLLLTYLIKYEAAQGISHLVGKFGTLGV